MPDPKKPYRIHAEAGLDVRLAARWYEQRQRGLGEDFIIAVAAWAGSVNSSGIETLTVPC